MKTIRTSWLALLVAASTLLTGCWERPPTDAVQHGFRGTGMEIVYNPRILASQADLNTPPAMLPQPAPGGARATSVYKNLRVLNNLSVDEFNRLMVSFTQWVSPEQGCAYCHNLANFADDSLYTKQVARRMIQMTQHVNAGWKDHVAQTGVTCLTCHRGNPVPKNVWFTPADPKQPRGFFGQLNGQNAPNMTVGLASLPNDPFTAYLLNDTPVRQAAQTPLPQGINSQGTSFQKTESTYGLMMHLSSALGVNCTYCHNTRAFGDWAQSPPQRTTAWHGLRMVRELNNGFMVPLTKTFPADRLGPKGDVAKVNCATCHQGAYKPLYGEQMAKAFPELLGPAVKLAGTEAVPKR